MDGFASRPAGGEIVDPSLEYAFKRIMELEGLLLVDAREPRNFTLIRGGGRSWWLVSVSK